MKFRKTWQRQIPKAIPRNLVWGIDLTGITDSNRKTRNILGIPNNEIRERYGKQAICTDNEVAFSVITGAVF